MEPLVTVTGTLQGFIAIRLEWDGDMDRYLYSEDVGKDRATYEVALIDAMLYSQTQGINIEDY